MQGVCWTTSLVTGGRGAPFSALTPGRTLKFRCGIFYPSVPVSPPFWLYPLIRSSYSPPLFLTSTPLPFPFFTYHLFIHPIMFLRQRALGSLAAPLRASRAASIRTYASPAVTVTSTRSNATAPLLGNIEASWKDLSAEEQYEIHQQLRELQKKDWKELTVDEKKAGECDCVTRSVGSTRDTAGSFRRVGNGSHGRRVMSRDEPSLLLFSLA